MWTAEVTAETMGQEFAVWASGGVCCREDGSEDNDHLMVHAIVSGLVVVTKF